MDTLDWKVFQDIPELKEQAVTQDLKDFLVILVLEELQDIRD